MSSFSRDGSSYIGTYVPKSKYFRSGVVAQTKEYWFDAKIATPCNNIHLVNVLIVHVCLEIDLHSYTKYCICTHKNKTRKNHWPENLS